MTVKQQRYCLLFWQRKRSFIIGRKGGMIRSIGRRRYTQKINFSLSYIKSLSPTCHWFTSNPIFLEFFSSNESCQKTVVFSRVFPSNESCQKTIVFSRVFVNKKAYLCCRSRSAAISRSRACKRCICSAWALPGARPNKWGG